MNDSQVLVARPSTQLLFSRRPSSIPARLKTPITTTSITQRRKLDTVKDMTTYFTPATIQENETMTHFANLKPYLASLARLPKSLIDIHLKACLQSDPGWTIISSSKSIRKWYIRNRQAIPSAWQSLAPKQWRNPPSQILFVRGYTGSIFYDCGHGIWNTFFLWRQKCRSLPQVLCSSTWQDEEPLPGFRTWSDLLETSFSQSWAVVSGRHQGNIYYICCFLASSVVQWCVRNDNSKHLLSNTSPRYT